MMLNITIPTYSRYKSSNVEFFEQFEIFKNWLKNIEDFEKYFFVSYTKKTVYLESKITNEKVFIFHTGSEKNFQQDFFLSLLEVEKKGLVKKNEALDTKNRVEAQIKSILPDDTRFRVEGSLITVFYNELKLEIFSDRSYNISCFVSGHKSISFLEKLLHTAKENEKELKVYLERILEIPNYFRK